MIVDRKFEKTLKISNVVNFCINKYDNVMTELNREYVSKCFNGVYILNIKKILDISKCNIIKTTFEANIHVMFIAEVAYVNRWDILIGAEVIDKKDLIRSAFKDKNKRLHITFKPTNINSNSIMLGQMVPVRVVETSHAPMKNIVSIAGVVLTCDREAPIYKVKGEVNLTALNTLLGFIKEELIKRNELMLTKKNNIKFFESLLYSYANMGSKENVTNIEGIDYLNFGNNGISIFDIKGDISGFWYRPLNICRSSPFIEKIEDSDVYHMVSATKMMLDFAGQIYQFIMAVNKLTEIYNDELIISHENVWDIMKKKQIAN